jgi:hypothetical protein
VAETYRSRLPIARYEERKRFWIGERDGGFMVVRDSVLKTNEALGQPRGLAQYFPEDTLDVYLRLGKLGELRDVQMGCDPVVPDCAVALRAATAVDLRRVIPRLPLWWPPRGFSWADTLVVDDSDRSRGARVTVVTRYRTLGDTTIGAESFWVVSWTSERRVAGASPSAPIQENGLVWVDKSRLIPAYAEWQGSAAPPPGIQALGATSTGFRGRAVLAGSIFERLAGEIR